MKSEYSTKVKAIEKWTYGFSGVGINIFFGMPMMYLVIYFTDVFGISAAAVGILLLVSRMWDAVNDPLMGVLVDRTKTRWGKCRPYMIFGPIFLFISFVMLFSGPTNLGSTGKLIYAYCAYIFFGMMYTMVDIPGNAMISTMTQNSKERTTISTIRRVFCNVGILIGAGAVVPLVSLLGQGNESKGYMLTTIILGVTGAVTIILSGVTAKERVKSHNKEKYSFKVMINVLKVNTPLLIISSVFMVNQLATTIKSAATAFYFSYNVGKPELIGIASGISLLATIVGTMCIPFFVKRLGKKKTIVYGLIGIAVSSLALFFIKYDNVPMILVQFVVNSFVSGFGLALPFIMVIDTVEYGEWKTGIRSEGLVFSTLTFATKLATAVGGALLGFILSTTGYVPKVAQSQAALNGILICIAGIPIVVALIGIVLMKFYSLDEKLYDDIVKELEERKASIN
ncbi:MFS transporter [Oceanirhabdus seepicola]|uniref:MFS transporter n=1 Tax=Oceanirhabdus seepicola TaxID=2828781 RepID=A0A9J6P4U4_9CLOT|nr:glycoside-pentoside-hexuronide (GPH):cation symporter [Oceanirhabdus seepicola]MCM1991735.1 MFS transporter [Oceanirhabdus seepicola]